MFGTATKRSEVTACVPLPYRIPAEVLAHHVAHETEGDRRNPDFLGTFLRTMEEALGEGISLELREALPEIYRDAWGKIHASMRDRGGAHLPHEATLMARALTEEFTLLWSEGVLVHRYVVGSQVKAPFADVYGSTYSLTGDLCAHCGKNPIFYSPGGGVKCVNTVECGWWVCGPRGFFEPLEDDEGSSPLEASSLLPS